MEETGRERKKHRRKPVPLADKAADLLARRRLSRGELRTKLLQRRYDTGEVEALLDRYEQLGFLNDRELAFDRATFWLESRPVSKRFLIYKLRQSLIPDNIARDAVEEKYKGHSEEDMAEKALEIEMRHTKKRDKLWGKLIRLGFAPDILRGAFERKLPPEDADD